MDKLEELFQNTKKIQEIPELDIPVIPEVDRYPRFGRKSLAHHIKQVIKFVYSPDICGNLFPTNREANCLFIAYGRFTPEELSQVHGQGKKEYYNREILHNFDRYRYDLVKGKGKRKPTLLIPAREIYILKDTVLFQYEYDDITKIRDKRRQSRLDILEPDVLKKVKEGATVRNQIMQAILRESAGERAGYRCLLTDLNYFEGCDAIHYKPHSKCTRKEKKDLNVVGLFQKTIHAFYDYGWISFTNEGELLISTKLYNDTIDLANLFKTHFNLEQGARISHLHPGNIKYIEWHRNNIFRDRHIPNQNLL